MKPITQPSSFFLFLCAILAAFSSATHAAVVGQWVASDLPSGAVTTWTDRIASRPAVNNGGPTKTANGVFLDGNDALVVAAANNPVVGDNTYTATVVCKVTAGATRAGLTPGNVATWWGNSSLIGRELPGGNRGDWAVAVNGLNGAVAGRGNPDTGVVGSTALNDGLSHVITGVFNGAGATIALFVDGAKIGTATGAGTSNIESDTMNFGVNILGNGDTAYFTGALLEIQIDNAVLADAAVVSLQNTLLSTYRAGPSIISFTVAPTAAYEGQNVTLSWNVGVSAVTGVYSYNILRGATSIATGTATSGTFVTPIPDLAGTAQNVTYTLQAIETGGTNVTVSAVAVVAGDPGVPSATSQVGLVTQDGTPLNITLAGTDLNGGTLSYVIVTPPTKGTLSAGTGAARTFTPTGGVYGADQFTFKVNDGKYDSAPATVRLTILTPPIAPTSVIVNDTTIRPENVAGDFLSTISSPDPNTGEAHTFTLVSGTGSDENANFSIVGNQLRAATSFAALTGVPQRIRIRSTDGAGLTVEGTFVLTVTPKVRGVVINEIHYNSSANNVRNAFVEIYNDGPTTINLAEWRLSGQVDFTFAEGTSLAPDAYLVVAEDPATILSYFSKTALGPWNNATVTYPDGSKESNNLSNDGGTVRLRNAADAVVSEVDYDNHSPWPAAGAGSGSSIELINPGLDAAHGSNWAAARGSSTVLTDVASPGVRNLQFSAIAAPAIRSVAHSPAAPTSADPIIITARITDPQGVASASLAYQIVTAGSFIPSTLPKTVSGGNFVNVTTPLAANPAFELPANWATVAMNDDGTGDDLLGGDGIWTASIAPQANRTLVRYRITTADNAGASARVPYVGDPSLNFACFVYNGVPAYEGTSAADLQKLPVYHFLTRKADFDQCVAYDANSSQRLVAGTSWNFENWEACFVCNGVVYDHIPYRLKGANGRYTASGTGGAGNGKRAFKFYFHKGYEFDAIDQAGNPYPEKWSTMITENLWENRASYTFSLNEMVDSRLFNELGVPTPRGHWSHFRTIMQTVEQPDKWHGDFWGLMWVHEDYDRRFLKAHDLKKGNLYKLTRDGTSGLVQFRYQSTFGPTDGSDHDLLLANLKGTSTPAYITGRVNIDLWARYHALCEAIRHYDYWPTGDNNGGWYFYPNYNVNNANKGVLWYLPNDLDATWGPTWNNGHDIVHNALFNDSASSGGDASTNPTLWPNYFNQVREVRRLLWQPDQINALIDEYAEVIRPIVNAEFIRWHPTNGAPADSGNFGGLFGPNNSALNPVGQTALNTYVASMKDFAFDADNNGSTWPGGNVGAGGRAAFLDTLGVSLGEDTTKYPATPTITYSGTVGNPVNDLRFTTSAFSDPQGAGTFAGIQWRVAEVNTSATWTAGVPRLLEISARHDSGTLATFAGEYRFPAASGEPGKRYRARVRMKDNTGRWSYWSNPVEFTAGTVDTSVLAQNLIISEIMYHSANPTPAEQSIAAGLGQTWDDDSFDYIELRNVGGSTLDIGEVRFSQGVNFTFPVGTTLAANATTLIVHNTAAFDNRYGTGKPVAGAWLAGNKLSNGGDQLNIKYGDAALPFYTMTYDDIAPWPLTADGSGPSLVLLAPETRPNPSTGTNWRASYSAGGTPGGDDRPNFSAWASSNNIGALTNDEDGDGISNLLEYGLAGNPATSSRSPLPLNGLASDYLTLTFRRLQDPADITYTVEFATSLASPFAADGTLLSSVNNGDGTLTQVWRAPAPGAQYFGRVKVVKP